MKRRAMSRRWPVLLVAAVSLYSLAAGAEALEKLIQQVMQQHAALARTQKKINKLSDSTSELAAEYRAVLEQLEAARTYNAQVRKLIEGQRQEMQNIQSQIDRAASVGRELVPLMHKMIDSLAAFVELDVPFLMKERRERIKRLREMMDRSDVADSEKFRRLLEAYQIEANYGHTIEDYSGELELEGKKLNVAFLRIGRLALMYITPDEQHLGFWNQQERKWQPLGPEYRDAIKKGLRMARKQTTYDLLRVLVPAPRDAAKGGES
ncbi:MAG: DUF3450 domain-containing protein [Deltaproteobacteria bacterium]|nr:MAG: DUF3450 domain-containing protein [Deltaproteobacteria bacterium]